MTDSIASHRALCPLAPVRPPTSPLNPQSVPLALHPLPRELASVRPRVDAARLEPALPRSRVLALVVGSRADTMPVSATLVRTTSVRAAVVEVEMTVGGWCRSLLCRTAGKCGRVTGADLSAHRPGIDDDLEVVVGTLTTTVRVAGWAIRLKAGHRCTLA